MIRAAAEPDQRGAGRPEKVDPEDIRRTEAEHGRDRGGLTAVLEDIQARYGYLPEEALRTVGDETGRSLVDIYGIATFYRSFSLEPRGKHLICACLGTACHVRGAPRIVDELESQLGVKRGQTTPDREFTLETVNCLGACALGPVVVIDGRHLCNVRKSEVADIIQRARRGLDETAPAGDDGSFPIDVSCPRCNHSLMDPSIPLDGLASIQIVVGFRNIFGPAHLSSLYGSFNNVCAADIPVGASCRFYCPRCHGELVGPSRCAECGSPLAPMIVRGGGTVHVCTRRGCRGHRLDLEGVNA